ncbi:MAG TPA: IS66 family transposase [Alloacidobacterium sp.]|jgi:transposase|nr:IS66 family transposase [Alloacidobacterium sp.]
MDRAPLPDLDALDRDALLDLIRAHEQQHALLIAAQDEEIRRLEAELDAQRQTLSEQAEELDSRRARIQHLKLMVEKFRHMIFGRKSEKLVLKLEQMEFELEEDETTQAEAEAIAERVSPSKEAKPRSERKPLPEHLKREEKMHKPDTDCCPDCGGGLRHFGDDVSEQLEYVPESFKVIRHVRPKFACTDCDRVVEAPAPSRPIERGLAGPSLLAHVIVSKYADHLPLFRQSEIYARQGVEISRSTMAGWVGASSDLLGPLVEAIGKHVFAGRKLHADDTPMPVLAPGNGKTKTGRLWTYVRDDRPAGEQAAPAVWFAYSEDRRGEHPRQHLKNFTGALQADAYAGFHHLYGNHIYEAACWAHARRKFHDIHLAHASPTTTEALARIGALYAIEDEIRGKPVDLRLSVRQTRAKPLLDDLRKWMEKALRSLSSKSETAAAIRYALSRWCALTRYTEDGLLEIDNSAAERALRAVALGRKNFLFAGSDCGGERAAAMYTLIGSAKLNGLDPELYLRTVLDQIADHPISQIQDLLPWNLAPSLQVHSSQAA